MEGKEPWLLKRIFIISVFAIITLGFAIYPVFANDATEERLQQ
jgi:hypothetical protein|tara:strand:+ start:50 stop:178 length:129 start_codon:yes stop_codon:yes gene_type:complete